MAEKPSPKVISATEASNNFGSLIDQAARSGRLFVITRMGKAKAVVMGLNQYRELLEALEINAEQEDPEFQAALREADEDLRLGRTLTLDELDKELGFTEEELNSPA